MAILPAGTSTAHFSPARAAYAAAEAEVLPVDAQTTALAPASAAAVMAMVMPRSLNEPVGFIALDLQVDLGAGQLERALRAHQRGAALAEGDDRRVRP